MSYHLVEKLPLDILILIEPFLVKVSHTVTPNALAIKGSLDGLRWLHRYQPYRLKAIGQKPMLLACKHGHFHIVQWLHEHGYRCRHSISYASYNGHYHIIQWLLQNGYQVDQTSILTCINYNHYFLGKFLLQRYRGHLDREQCLLCVARNGTILAIDWFLKGDVTQYNMRKIISEAVKHGNINVVRILHTRYNVIPLQGALDVATRRGHFQVVKYCVENQLDSVSDMAITDAIVNGQVNVLEFLNPEPHHIQKWASK